MAFFLILIVVGLVVYFKMRGQVRDHEGRMQHQRDAILAKVQVSGPERRSQFLRTDMNRLQWWHISLHAGKDRLSVSELDTLADFLYVEGAAKAFKESLRSQDANKRRYMMAALLEDARYVASKGEALGDSPECSIVEAYGGTLPTLEDGIARELLVNGSGSPGQTAEVVVRAYQLFAPEDHNEEWEEVFTTIVDMRNVAALHGGHAPVPKTTIDELVWLTWSGSGGCLAVLAFGIIWLELDQRRREAMRDPKTFTLVTQVIFETVRQRAPEAIRSDLMQLRLKALKLMGKSEVSTLL